MFGTRFHGTRKRDVIDHVLKELKLAYKPKSEYNSVIFIERKDRRILNIQALAKVAERLGFKNVRVVVFESLTVREQMAIVVDTDVLIGVHGAGLQWAIFMRPRSAVIEILWPKKHWGSFYAFVRDYHVKFYKFETENVFVNWHQYEIHWGKISDPVERIRMLNNPPRNKHDNIWKYADVIVDVNSFRTNLKQIKYRLGFKF